MSYKRMNETHRINKAVVVSYSIISIILQLAYILELVKGSRTVGYTIIFSALNLIPYIACMVIYCKDRSSSMMKYVMCIGYSVLYAFVLLTAAVPTTYVYIFLMLFLLIPYGKKSLCFITGGVALASNVISIIVGFATEELTTDDLASIEIQLAAVLLAGVFVVLVTHVIGKVNEQKLSELNEEKEKIDELLSNTLEVSKGISEDIAVVSERMEELERAVNTTKDSMKDVSHGATETAESMQAQLLQTEEIVSQVQKTKDVTRTIAEDMQETDDAIAVGKGNIDQLLEFVEQSEEVGAKVASKMKELTTNMEKMNAIVEMINSITNQTSLLSLNASIEAARAGEAGRGFTVVAGEISGLAGQTRTATVDITKLIGGITASIEEVFDSINDLVEKNKEQNQAAAQMAESFERIEAHTKNISKVSSMLEEVVEELDKSNKVIIEGIDSVSAVTEEVSARATETFAVSENNAETVEEITGVIKELNSKAQKLHE